MRRTNAFLLLFFIVFWCGAADALAQEDEEPSAALAETSGDVDASVAEGAGVVADDGSDTSVVLGDDTIGDAEASVEEAAAAAPKEPMLEEEPVPVAKITGATEEPAELVPGMGSPTAYGGFEASLSPQEHLSGFEIGGFLLLGGGLAVTAAGGVLWAEEMGQLGAVALGSGAALSAAGAGLFFAHTMMDESDRGVRSSERTLETEVIPTVGMADDSFFLGVVGRF